MQDLFLEKSKKPLAELLRPNDLDDIIGQHHLVSSGSPLRIIYDGKHIQSMILWGPPGVGKTTLARILGQNIDAQFIVLSAVLSGVKEIREAIDSAKNALSLGKQTIIFVDEVHRFNKSQQDAFLPHVESGLLTFIGATTENPSFEVNSALLSRAQVYQLYSLKKEDLFLLFSRVIQLNRYQDLSIQKNDMALIIDFADGDARKLFNLIEQIFEAAITESVQHITTKFCQNILGEKSRRFDKGGDQFYEQISALHKSVRGSHPNAALYWLCRMLDGGADPKYLARRVIRMAWEDIGLADPRAMQIANEAALTYERLGSPEGELALAEAVIFLSCAAKSNAAYKAYNEAKKFVKEGQSYDVPIHLRNAPTNLLKNLNYGKSYRYAHDEPNAYAAGERYMPDELLEPKWYQPVDQGLEISIKSKLKQLEKLDEDYQRNNKKNE